MMCKEFIAMHAMLNENIFNQVYYSATIGFCTSMECFSTPCSYIFMYALDTYLYMYRIVVMTLLMQ